MEFEVIRCREAHEYLNRRDVVFIDLRPPEQYQEYHLPGAYNYPYDLLAAWENRLPGGRMLVLYCEHGNLSLMAAKRLAKRGYRVAALIGGVKCFLAQNPIDTTNFTR